MKKVQKICRKDEWCCSRMVSLQMQAIHEYKLAEGMHYAMLHVGSGQQFAHCCKSQQMMINAAKLHRDSMCSAIQHLVQPINAI